MLHPRERLRVNEYIKEKKAFFEKSKKVDQISCHSGKVHSVGWNSTGKYLASCSNDRTVHLAEFDGSKLSKSVICRGHTDSVDQLSWQPGSSSTFATASADKTVRIWDSRNSKSTSTIATKGENINLCWNPTGNYIVVGNKEDLISVIDVRSCKIRNDHQFKFEVNELAFDKAGDCLLLTTGHGFVNITNFNDFKTIQSVRAHTSSTICIKFSPDGKFFGTGGADAVVSIFDYERLTCVTTVSRLDWPVRALSFNHDNHLIAAGSEDTFIDISSVHTGDSVWELPLESPPAHTVAWHPSAYILAYGSEEKERDSRDNGAVKLFGIRLSDQ